jgi:transcriptional regulator with XRE-family HTH domain
MNNEIDIIKKQIGENIKDIRREKKIEVKTLCQDLDLSPAGYSNIERGVTDINISRIIQLSGYFGVHFSKILSIDNVTNYYFHQPNGGTQNNGQIKNDLADGYRFALEQLKQDNDYLKGQNERLLAKLFEK